MSDLSIRRLACCSVSPLCFRLLNVAALSRCGIRHSVDAALVRPERRIKTKPSKAAKAKRVDSKKARSSIKAGRGRVRGID